MQGELTITADMEVLGNALFLDNVPDTWLKRAYPSMYGLASWYTDLLLRVRELESWISDFQLPPSVWLGGFFNPQSFLTAIMQQVRASSLLSAPQGLKSPFCVQADKLLYGRRTTCSVSEDKFEFYIC